MASPPCEGDRLLKQFWQTYNFSLQDTSSTTRDKADRIRSLLFFLQELHTCKSINTTSFEILHKTLSLQYHSLVDCMDKEKGVDNYSEMLNALSDGKINESRHWVSKLSMEENRQPLCMKDLQTGKKEPRNMKIGISKKYSRCYENFPEKIRRDVMDRGKQNDGDDGRRNITSTQPPQNSSQKVEIRNAVTIPTFAKRKNSYFDGGIASKKQPKVNSMYPGNPNISSKKTPVNENSKAIIYGRGSSNPYADKDCPENRLELENPFSTAREQLKVDMKKSGKPLNYGQKKKSLGARGGGGVNGRFVPPIGQEKSEKNHAYGEKKSEVLLDSKYEEFEWMKNIDPKMVELIENEVMDHGPQVSWNDIAGLEFAKSTIQEIVIWPMLRPDIFTGLRGPPKGLLLFGPPGTGKTLIGKCIASQSNAKFFNISASSLTSKWVGDGEKMMRALFGVARCEQPAVIFIDEIDSLLTQRSESEHESSRRIKTEFLVQLDGATASSDDRLLVVGATNRPQELDEAARRRLVKRLYIPLPDAGARKHIVKNLMSNQQNSLLEKDMEEITSKTDGFSGADMTNLCREAALGPIRSIGDIRNINADEVRPINLEDFQSALKHVRPSVSQNDLQIYVNWNNLYGSGGVS